MVDLDGQFVGKYTNPWHEYDGATESSATDTEWSQWQGRWWYYHHNQWHEYDRHHPCHASPSCGRSAGRDCEQDNGPDLDTSAYGAADAKGGLFS